MTIGVLYLGNVDGVAAEESIVDGGAGAENASRVWARQNRHASKSSSFMVMVRISSLLSCWAFGIKTTSTICAIESTVALLQVFQYYCCCLLYLSLQYHHHHRLLFHFVMFCWIIKHLIIIAHGVKIQTRALCEQKICSQNRIEKIFLVWMSFDALLLDSCSALSIL